MFDIHKHQLVMNQILHGIYNDQKIASLLGFKGGTCAYYFYDLPRFSVDLDFDILEFDEELFDLVLSRIRTISQKYGEVQESMVKKWTLLTLVSYGKNERHLKVEINIRKYEEQIRNHFELKPFLGTAMLVNTPAYMFASKLCALTDRRELATRDIFDIYYFASKQWEIDEPTVKIRTGNSLITQLQLCIKKVEGVSENFLLFGLGELINDKQKYWVKNAMKKETIFLMQNYLTTYQQSDG